MSEYKKKVKMMIIFQNLMVAILLIILALFLYNKLKPKIVQTTLSDECQPIGGIFSHSIDDEGACQNACRANCDAKGLRFHGVSFDPKTVPCYTCDCYCKE